MKLFIHGLIHNLIPMDQLIQQFPSVWNQSQKLAQEILSINHPDTIKNRIIQLHQHLSENLKKLKTNYSKNPEGQQLIQNVVQFRLSLWCIEKSLRQFTENHQNNFEASSKKNKTLTLKEKIISQLLFFNFKGQRKTVSKECFLFFWKYIDNKGRLTEILQSTGIYAIYSTDLIHELCKILKDKKVLEVAAGDGTLGYMIKVNKNFDGEINITDDHSWTHKIKFPTFVEKLSATQALEKYRPQIVISSWPPPDNSFEKEIFHSPTVEMYIVIGSKHEFATGNQKSYQHQNKFKKIHRHDLTDMTLPQEWDHQVIQFIRK